MRAADAGLTEAQVAELRALAERIDKAVALSGVISMTTGRVGATDLPPFARGILALLADRTRLVEELELYKTVQGRALDAWALEFQPGGRHAKGTTLTLGDSIIVEGGRWLMAQVAELTADRTRLQTALAAAEDEADRLREDDLFHANARADAAEQQAATLRAVLQALYDVQNGAPLEKYRSDWEAAMEQAHALLAPPPRRTEVVMPCPACGGTGHSGNLHDETCHGCDGGGRA